MGMKNLQWVRPSWLSFARSVGGGGGRGRGFQTRLVFFPHPLQKKYLSSGKFIWKEWRPQNQTSFSVCAPRSTAHLDWNMFSYSSSFSRSFIKLSVSNGFACLKMQWKEGNRAPDFSANDFISLISSRIRMLWNLLWISNFRRLQIQKGLQQGSASKEMEYDIS